jgi:hypothetical protein
MRQHQQQRRFIQRTDTGHERLFQQQMVLRVQSLFTDWSSVTRCNPGVVTRRQLTSSTVMATKLSNAPSTYTHTHTHTHTHRTTAGREPKAPSWAAGSFAANHRAVLLLTGCCTGSYAGCTSGVVGTDWTTHIQYNTIHYGGTSLGNLRVALACEPRRLIPYSLVSYPSYPLGD